MLDNRYSIGKSTPRVVPSAAHVNKRIYKNLPKASLEMQKRKYKKIIKIIAVALVTNLMDG